MSSGKYKLNTVNVRLVQESTLISDYPIDSSEKAVKLVAEEFKTYDREVVAVINLNTKLKPVNLNICSIGTIDSSLISPREVLKSSILSNAKAFILVHNHPSGELTPSQADIATTKRLAQCGNLLGIEMLDSVIIAGETGEHISLRERELMPAEADLQYIFEENSSKYGETDIESVKVSDNRVYMNVHNRYAKTGVKAENGRAYNMVTLPKGLMVGDKDLSEGRIYPLDNNIYPNKFNQNLTTVQFLEDQNVRINLDNGEFAMVNAKELTNAVDQANKKYLDENREKMVEAEKAEKETAKSKENTRTRSKNEEVEM